MKKKIMVVDDEPDIVDLTKTIFEMDGYKVFTAKNGKECLDKLEKQKVDLDVLDIMMPHMSGWDVAVKIKGTPKWNNIPIIFLTAKEDLISKDAGSLVAEKYIVKPFDKKKLLESVALILKR